MGLKEMHLVFITAAVILFLGTAWAFFFVEELQGSILNAFFGVCCLIIGLGLAVYEVYFIQKAKGISDN
ncbi:hypothetical protein DB346_06875 [Verrucomicrobia bacterium LW23]|nr:hypothetical protein DB346_06875 [Verrucomicrobia bacterium LW23]